MNNTSAEKLAAIRHSQAEAFRSGEAIGLDVRRANLKLLKKTLLKWEKPLAKYAGHHGIMVRRNGKIKGYTIPEELQKHIFKKIDILKPNEEIDDYMNQRVAYIYYKYDDKQEALDTIKRMNDIIKVEFAD